MGKKLIVEILSAHNLMPKDGHGSDNAYCLVEFDGQRQTTKVKNDDLNPVWNEKLEFQIRDPCTLAHETVRIDVWSANPREKFNRKKDAFLGKVHISGSSIKKQGDEAFFSCPLQKRSPLSHVKGELRLRVYIADESKKDEGKKEDAKKEGEAKKEGGEKKNAEKKDGDKKEEKKEHAEKKVVEIKKVERPAPPTVVPAADYALKERTPVVTEKIKTYDLVEKMQYLYVRVVKGRHLSKDDPFVCIKFGEAVYARKKAAKKDKIAVVWDEVFAFSKDKIQGPTVEIVVAEDEKGSKDLGSVIFEINEIPFRVPDSPLAPQWYSLEDRKTRLKKDEGGDIMLAVWMGTQEDESFSTAWQSDTGGLAHTKSKVYLSPKLWYLRVNVIEAQDLAVVDKSRFPEVYARVQLGNQKHMTRMPKVPSASPMWNQSFLFVAAEPFEEHLVVSVENRVGPKKEEQVGIVKISLAGNKQIVRRTDGKEVLTSHWYTLEKNCDKGFKGRVHLRLCLEGGYHVMDESTNYISDVRPTAKQLWKKPLGVLQVGILQAKSLLPMKTKDGRGTTDAYCVAKYGPKWVRTRTVLDSLNPKWNEQYSWEVYDPCTVVTVCVFDNCHLADSTSTVRDGIVGKVRIRLSTLESNKVYANSYPLIVLTRSGVKKMGDLELTVRFATTTLINVLQVYFQPQLPKLHYTQPLMITEQEVLRVEAIRIVAARLARAEPPLRNEVIRYMLDTDSNLFSMRRSKANYARLTNVFSGCVAVCNWFREICKWSAPVTTVLVHVLFLILAWFPELILPTLFLYLFLIGAWQYRYRPRAPPSMDAQLSHATSDLTPDELDEEFDTIFTTKPPDIVKVRYERLRIVASRLQTVVGDIAAQGERVIALLSWRDPRATGVFITFCLVVAIVLYVTPFKVIAILVGLYILRHPRFRNKAPPVPMNFFRRLPSLADRIL